MDNVTTVLHPLVQHRLALLRDKSTLSVTFRALLREIAAFLCYEMTRDLPLEPIAIETPLTPTTGRQLSGKNLVFAPVLRAGLGFLDGMLDLLPSAAVAHIGVFRDPVSLAAVEYYFKAPPDLAERPVIVVDPMLATGNSAVAAVDRLKQHGAVDLRLICLLATPAGLANLKTHHPEVRVWTAAIDPELNAHGYIVPGLGDAGDRLYGTL